VMHTLKLETSSVSIRSTFSYAALKSMPPFFFIFKQWISHTIDTQWGHVMDKYFCMFCDSQNT
jgi:hypothetical protein